MAVIIITGSVGAGKSYTAVRDFVLDGLADGRRIVTNLVGVESDKIASVFGWGKIRGEMIATNGNAMMAEASWPKVSDKGEIVTPGNLIDGGDTVIVDECAILFERGKREPPNFIHRYLAVHRHLPGSAVSAMLIGRSRVSGDVVFLAQELGHIPDSIRKLCSRWIRCRNMAFMAKGMSGRYRIEVYGYAPQTERVADNPLYTETRALDPRIFKCYQSHATEEAIAESRPRKGMLDQTGLKIKLAVIGFGAIGGAAIAGYSLFGFDLLDPEKIQTKTQMREVQNETAPTETQPQPGATVPPPVREIAPQPVADPRVCTGRFVVERGGATATVERDYKSPDGKRKCRN